MRAVLLRSLVVVGIGGLILAGLLYVASTVDRRAPTVAGIALTQPVPDETSVALITTGLAVEFTEPVETASAPDALTIDPAVPGSVSWSGSTMIFTPREPLDVARSYTVTVGPGVRDLAGNPMTELPGPFTFETTGPPEVVETVPADGAEEVALGEPIAVTFSTLMDTASVEAALRLRPAFAHELRWSGRLLEIVPSEPLETDREYQVAIGEDAFDVSGVALDAPASVRFRTVSPGLQASVLIPADGADGIAPTSPIAIIFDRPVEPGSISADGLLTITPDVAGSLALVDADGGEPAEPSDGTILRFVPSGPLPANTTFEVMLATAVTSLSGDGLAEVVTWSFTTGAPQATLSNQVAFLSDRSGVPNLWAMNPDGTAPRQLSAELTPILDYAVAPDGSSFVVGDGRRLVQADASGTNRRVLTAEGFIEFDPTFAPNGERIAFARADAETGLGLGLWERAVDAGDATPIELAGEPTASPVPSGSAEDGDSAQWLRAPRYAPDGQSLAFVDLDGSVGIIDLATDEPRRVRYEAHAPAAWLPDSSAILLTGRRPAVPGDPAFGDRIEPLEPAGDVEVAILEVSGSRLGETGFGTDARVAAVATDGRVAYLRGDGSLRIAEAPRDAGGAVGGLRDERIGAASFAPGEESLVIVVLPQAGGEATDGRIERIELDDGERTILTNDGWRPRWLP
ncbi:MAG: Ig-like domain-containing protein [Chloroflexi bacterium]|nr:Ig-like domain-containing protein [Chloroflexota bacterium]